MANLYALIARCDDKGIPTQDAMDRFVRQIHRDVMFTSTAGTWTATDSVTFYRRLERAAQLARLNVADEED